MALGANSYGDTDEIAALVPRYTNSGAFDGTTSPTLTQVESETDQISGAVNMVLSELGFDIPVTQADVKLMLDGFVNKMVAEIVHGIRGAGRFGPTSQQKKGEKGKWMMIMEDVRDFLTTNALGLERLGATRTYSISSSIGYRDTDESGDDTHPLFPREAYGETYKNWDD